MEMEYNCRGVGEVSNMILGMQRASPSIESSPRLPRQMQPGAESRALVQWHRP